MTLSVDAGICVDRPELELNTGLTVFVSLQPMACGAEPTSRVVFRIGESEWKLEGDAVVATVEDPSTSSVLGPIDSHTEPSFLLTLVIDRGTNTFHVYSGSHAQLLGSGSVGARAASSTGEWSARAISLDSHATAVAVWRFPLNAAHIVGLHGLGTDALSAFDADTLDKSYKPRPLLDGRDASASSTADSTSTSTFSAPLPQLVSNGYHKLLALSLATDYTFERAQAIKDLLKNPSTTLQVPACVINTRFLTQEGQCSRQISISADGKRAARDRGTDDSLGWCAVQLSRPDIPANGSVSISFELSCRFVRLGWAAPSLNLESDAEFSHYAAAGCFICSAGSAGPSNEVAFGLGNVDASQYSAFQSSADQPASVTMVYTRLSNSNSTIGVSVNGGESTLVFSRVPDNLIPVVVFGDNEGNATIICSSAAFSSDGTAGTGSFHCANGHELVRQVDCPYGKKTKKWFCDKCRSAIPLDTVGVLHCAACKFDVCLTCSSTCVGAVTSADVAAAPAVGVHSGEFRDQSRTSHYCSTDRPS
jgi:hypothetical protein